MLTSSWPWCLIAVVGKEPELSPRAYPLQFNPCLPQIKGSVYKDLCWGPVESLPDGVENTELEGPVVWLGIRQHHMFV